MDELTKRIQQVYEESIVEAGMKMSRQEAIKNLEKGVLSTPMLEPLGISMDSFLRFSQLPSTKQQELLKKMAKGFKSKDWKDPKMWKKLAKEGKEILESNLKEQIARAADDVLLNGVSLKNTVKDGVSYFKKEFPQMYKLAKEVVSDSEMEKFAYQQIILDINNKKLKEDMLSKLSEKQIKEQIARYTALILSGDFLVYYTDQFVKAVKEKNKWLENKIKMLKR